MAKAVLDASIVVKWFVDEPGSKDALALRDKYVEGDLQIVAPSHLHCEVLNALVCKRLHSAAELRDISTAIDSYFFDLRQLNGATALAALRIASENAITIYDSSYAALAYLENVPLYTADRSLAEKLSSCRGVSVTCISR